MHLMAMEHLFFDCDVHSYSLVFVEGTPQVMGVCGFKIGALL